MCSSTRAESTARRRRGTEVVAGLVETEPPVHTHLAASIMETNKLRLLANAMQAYSWRAKALTSNIANLDTPGYRRLSVKFEEALQEARHSIDGPDGMAHIKADMAVEETPPILEDELMEMADTQMRTQLVSRALREHFATLRTGITGRSG